MIFEIECFCKNWVTAESWHWVVAVLRKGEVWQGGVFSVVVLVVSTLLVGLVEPRVQALSEFEVLLVPTDFPGVTKKIFKKISTPRNLHNWKARPELSIIAP